MSNYQATETCSCGATLTTEAYTTDLLARLLAEFREAHKPCREPAPRAVISTPSGAFPISGFPRG